MEQIRNGFSTTADVPYMVRCGDIARDEADILRLCKASTLNCPPEKYRWKYTENPLRPTWCALAIDNASEQIVGTTALFPRRLLVDGIPIRAAVAGDFAVEKEHRTLFPALALQRAAVRACNAGEFDVLYGFPNDAASGVQLRAGFRKVAPVRVGVRLLDWHKSLQRLGRWRWPAGRDVLASITNLVSREPPPAPASTSYKYCNLQGFDARFDRFWGQILPNHRIVVERSVSYANWRFMACPTRKYSVFAAVHDETGEIGGYIISWSHNSKTHICDVMAYDAAFQGLLTSFIKWQRELDTACILIVYIGGHSFVRKLQRFGFLFQHSSSELLLYPRRDLRDSERLFCSDSWYLFDGDSDF